MRYLHEILKDIVSNMTVTAYFMHEKQIKANEILTQMDVGRISASKKYPLVLLLRPFTLTNEPDYITADFTLVIVGLTKREYTSDERYANVITPILEPIVNELMTGIIDSAEISQFSYEDLEFKRTDDCLIDGNPLPDTLDGIGLEFTNIKLKNC